MAGKGISSLSWPADRYRIDRLVTGEKDIGFETIKAAVAEDRLRVLAFRRTAKNLFSPTLQKQAAGLAKQLERGLLKKGANSLASMRRMRRHRIKVIGHLQELLERSAELFEPVAFVTIRRKNWRVAANDVFDCDIKDVVRDLQNDLHRAGWSEASGWGFFALHGSFDESDHTFSPHFHGVVVGDSIAVIERLRSKWPKRYTATKGDDQGGQIWITRGSSLDLKLLTYCIQSFWNLRAYLDPRTGERVIRRTKRRRIPEPFHSMYLLWLHRLRLEEITVLKRLRVKQGRFDIRKQIENE